MHAAPCAEEIVSKGIRERMSSDWYMEASSLRWSGQYVSKVGGFLGSLLATLQLDVDLRRRSCPILENESPALVLP